ncbi:hypothetical protein C8E01_101416 [Pontibacter virosus]|uniref:Uncharacterized protein n=1 Tax=Pontibacter virosus TaxID=1765052 RepID=A0A2U1B5U6_9BACT|nr:hypothetical protein C8E01_101416 [Pontibacter virosus]
MKRNKNPHPAKDGGLKNDACTRRYTLVFEVSHTGHHHGHVVGITVVD